VNTEYSGNDITEPTANNKITTKTKGFNRWASSFKVSVLLVLKVCCKMFLEGALSFYKL